MTVEAVIAPEDEIVKVQRVYFAIIAAEAPSTTVRASRATLQDSIQKLVAEESDAPEVEKESYFVTETDSLLSKLIRGRLGIHELLAINDAMKSSIKTKASTDVIRIQAIAGGMTTLKQDGILKVMQGLTDIQEIRRVCIK